MSLFFREGVNRSGASNRNKKVIGRQMEKRINFSTHYTYNIKK